jgi:hypothetical protein
VDHVFLGMRPWTRESINHMLEDTAAHIEDADAGPLNDQAEQLYEALAHELRNEMAGPCLALKGNTRIESVYSLSRVMTGTPLRDSFHMGSTVVNDYGRPYANGFNNYTGASAYAIAGRFTLYARGEFQYAPSSIGYSPALAQSLSTNDTVPYINPGTGLPFNQATIPAGNLSSAATMRWMELYASYHVLNHEISFGKQVNWMGPGLGAGFAYSNNAENIYSFNINRVEPLRIPWLSYITGPFRYEFLVGSLKGHVAPNSPWVHVEKVSFKPTENLEFGFERTVTVQQKSSAAMIRAPASAHSISRTASPGFATGSRCMPMAKFTTTCHRSTHPAAPRGGQGCIFPMYLECLRSICARRQSTPIPPSRPATAADSCTGRWCRYRDIPTTAVCLVTGLAARARVARHGSPII